MCNTSGIGGGFHDYLVKVSVEFYPSDDGQREGEQRELGGQQFTFVLRHYKYTSTTNTPQLYRLFSIHRFLQSQKPVRWKPKKNSASKKPDAIKHSLHH